jgi:transcriptional regulator with XRE-family HTH domain
MDKVGIDDKSLKDKKKNENKAWLSQRLSELGEDRIIYTSNSTGRHPYTKEVLLLAERQGSRQADMAEACEVSQSQISQWMSGQSKATNEQLEPLIDLISPLMPGRSFFIEKIVKEVVFKLPDDWEEKAVAAFLRKKASNMPGFDPASIQQSAYGGVVSE